MPESCSLLYILFLLQEERVATHKRILFFLKMWKKWHYRLFTSKMLVMFAYGFAVPIDWETHQLLSKTE